jgi:hypothetical protein
MEVGRLTRFICRFSSNRTLKANASERKQVSEREQSLKGYVMESIIVLERRALPEINPQDAITQDVLDYAHTQLGYHHPNKDKLCREGSLAQALRIAGVIPLNLNSVRNYKEQQVRKFQDGNGKRGMFFFRILLVSLGLAIASAIVFLVNNPGVVKVTGSVCALLFTTVFVVALVVSVFSIPNKKVSWRVIDLKEYASPVPGFALATAMEIHQRMSGASFFIDEMIMGETEVQKDPFLVVRGDGEEYYVEVWDEPGYAQKKKA